MDVAFQALIYSVAQAAISTFVSLGIAVCFLPFIGRISGAGQRLILGVCVVFSMISTTLVALMVQGVYGSGLIAIIVAHVIINAPFGLYMLHGAYQAIDMTLVQAARDLGATRLQLYQTIIIPCMRSAVISSAGIIFLLCFSSFSPIKVLALAPHHYTLTMLIAHAYKAGDAAALWCGTVVRLLVIIPVVVLPKLVVPCISAHIACPLDRVERKRTIKRIAFFLLLLFLCGVQNSFGVPLHELYDVVQCVCGISWMHILMNTLVVAVVSSLGSTFIGSVVCWHVWKSQHAVSRRACMMIAALPSIMGGIALAWCCKAVTGGVISTRMMIIMVQIILHYPFAFRLLNARMSTYSDEWQLHAYSMGATRWQWVRTIWLPFFFSALKRGLLLTGGLSLSDAGLMSVLSDNSESTLAMIVHQMRDAGYGSHALALSICTQLFFLCVAVLWE